MHEKQSLCVTCACGVAYVGFSLAHLDILQVYLDTDIAGGVAAPLAHEKKKNGKGGGVLPGTLKHFRDIQIKTPKKLCRLSETHDI